MTDFLSQADQLSRNIGRRTSRERFSDVALEELSRINFSRLFSQDILPALRERNSVASLGLPHQCNFSDECFVLYADPKFSIEVYHWEYSDTGIHDHDFEGAFQCLSGEDHQVEFQFIKEKEVFHCLEIGTLKKISEEILTPGRTQEIRSKDNFIHLVTHYPSTFNICVRTRKSPEQRLHTYHLDGIRYFFDDVIGESIQKVDEEFEELSSPALFHVFHKQGPGKIRKEVSEILKQRHAIDFLESHQKNLDVINQLGKIAKGY